MIRFAYLSKSTAIAAIVLHMVFPTNTLAQSGEPGPMIEISATIFDFRYDQDTQFGVFYQYNADSGNVGDSDIFLQGTQNVADDAIPALNLSGNFAKLEWGSIEYNIKTAIQEGKGSVFSNPSVLVADGQTAEIISGEEVPITEVEEKGTKTTLKTVPRKTGIKLIVTPYIYKRDNILMQLEIESSEITRFEVFDRGDSQRFELPVVATRNIQSVIIIPNERKLYIGGLYTDLSSQITRKVPLLGDVPGIGYFLRGFSKNKSRAETVFQITPIIRHPGTGITRQDVSIFSELLEPEGSDQLVDQYQLLEKVSAQKQPPQSQQTRPEQATIRKATQEVNSDTGKSSPPFRPGGSKTTEVKPLRF